MSSGTLRAIGASVIAVALDVGAVRAAEVDEDPRSACPVPAPRTQLGVTRARIDIAVRIERDLALGMTPESDRDSVAGNSWRWPRRLPATWSMTTRTRRPYHREFRVTLSAAEPPGQRAGDRADREVPAPGRRPRCASRWRAGPSSLDRQRGGGRRIPMRDRSTACWPVTGIDGGIDGGRDADPGGEPARDVRRRRSARDRPPAADRTRGTSAGRRRRPAVTSRSPATSHTIAVMLSLPPAARAAATSSFTDSATVCGSDIRSASAGSPTRPCSPSLQSSTRSPRRSSMIDSDGSTSSPTPSACRIAPPALAASSSL